MSAFNIRIQCLFLANYSSCILLFAGIMSSAQTGPADPICTRKILFLKCYGNILVIFQVYTCYIPVIYIQKVYAWYIPGMYMVYDHLCRNPGIYLEKTLWVCSVPVTYPYRHVICKDILGVSALRRRRVSTARLWLSSLWACLLSAVSSTDRPPRRGLPRPNCHSHGLTS